VPVKTKEVAHIAVFRVERTNDYTIMANHHLRSRTLSLKAKGLLSQMLSLPEDWDYTLKGLAVINRDGIDAVRETVKELEAAGYIVRENIRRNKKGRFQGAAYTIYEYPITDSQTTKQTIPVSENPISEKPTLENPTSANPMQDNPISENPTQLITNIPITNSTFPHGKSNMNLEK
jgi:hypothetical protein